MLKRFAQNNDDEGFALALEQRDIYQRRRLLTKALAYLAVTCAILGVGSVCFGLLVAAPLETRILVSRVGIWLVWAAAMLATLTVVVWIWRESALGKQISDLRDRE